MRKEFNELVETMKRWDLFQKDDEVDMALNDLGAKIDEVEKRIECAVRSAKEINESISKYTEEIDDELPIKMSVNDHDLIQNCSDDVRIALDLNDDMSIDDNWYSLFPTKKEDEETYPIVNCMDCGHPQPLLEENVYVDKLGRHVVCEQCEGSFNVGGDELKPIAVGKIEYDFPEEVYTIGNADNSEIIGDVYESEFHVLLDLGVIITENDNGFPFGKTNYIVLDNKFISIVKKKQIDLSKVPIIKQEVFMSFESSWGTLTCDKEGYVIEVIGDEEFNGERNYLYDIWQIDLAEYEKFLNSIGQNLDHDADDILVVGFWKKDGTYEEADMDWRKNIFGDAPTVLCQSQHTHDLVRDIIGKLKVIEVDGETMEYILRQVGMEGQMLKQLFTQTTNDDVDNLLDIRDGRS